MASLEQIRKQVVSCTKCELCKTRKNAVPGRGNPNSEIVFIGEAPGRSEDKLGQPFVGAAGKKLEMALQAAGIKIDSVFITNVVKCRPPNNRVPSQREIDSCQKYLKMELELIKPQIICLMGNTVYRTVLGGKGNITKNQGKILSKGGCMYFLTVHPAATIYNQELLVSFQKDIKKLARTLAKLKKKQVIKKKKFQRNDNGGI